MKIKLNKKLSKVCLVLILILLVIFCYKIYGFYNLKEYTKELIDESINSYGKDKLTVVKIKSDKYFRVSDILGGDDKISKDKISFGDYNNRIYISLNSKKLFYYSPELNRNIEIDYSDFDDFYIIDKEKLYINSKYFNLVVFGFGNQLIETEKVYKYITNYFDYFMEELEEIRSYNQKDRINYEDDFEILSKAIEIYYPLLNNEKHRENIVKHRKKVVKSNYLGFFIDNLRNFLDEYNNRHFSLENFKDNSITVYRSKEFFRGSKIKVSKENTLLYDDKKITKIEGENIYEDKIYKEAVKKNSFVLFTKWMRQFENNKNITTEDGTKYILEKTILEIVDENFSLQNKHPMKLERLSKETLLIDIENWTFRDVDKLLLEKDYLECQNIIIDIRDNRGGYETTIIDMIRVISNKEVEAYTKKGEKIIKESFFYTDSEGNYGEKGSISPINKGLEKRIVVLMNEVSYSASNKFTALLKENNIGLLIGEKSGGGEYMARYFYQENGNLLGVPSSFGLFSKEGYDYENGVEPDIYVKDEIIDGKDMVLERALKELKN